MISTGRSYEAVRNATRRDHLMPVKATLHVGRWEARVLYAVVGIAAAVVVCCAAVSL